MEVKYIVVSHERRHTGTLKIECCVCGARLVGLTFNSVGDIVPHPEAKKPTSTYPYCSRCWIKHTNSGKENLRVRQGKYYRKHESKEFLLGRIKELCEKLGFRLKTSPGHGLWEFEIWDRYNKPIYNSNNVRDLVTLLKLDLKKKKARDRNKEKKS